MVVVLLGRTGDHGNYLIDWNIANQPVDTNLQGGSKKSKLLILAVNEINASQTHF